MRLAHLDGMGGAEAAASVIVDTTVGVATQLVFVSAGVTLLLIRSTDVAALLAARVVLIGIAGFVAAMTIFVWLQHRNMAVALTGFVHRLIPEDWRSVVSDGASAIDDEVVATYRRRPALLRASVLRFATWVTGAGEIWLVTYFLGRSLSMTDALILESLGNGIYAAAFIVPGAIGVLEGGFVMFGALFGLPADISLTISLSKRVRELLLGLPGLLAWQWTETQGLWRRNDIVS